MTGSSRSTRPRRFARSRQVSERSSAASFVVCRSRPRHATRRNSCGMSRLSMGLWHNPKFGSSFSRSMRQPHAENAETAGRARAIPPAERLRAAVEAEFADVCVLKASYGAKDDPKTIRGVLAIGGADSRSALVRQIGESHGVALPEDTVEVVSREQWDLLRRLEKLGIISFARRRARGATARTRDGCDAGRGAHGSRTRPGRGARPPARRPGPRSRQCAREGEGFRRTSFQRRGYANVTRLAAGD